jgi:hypothetical protein
LKEVRQEEFSAGVKTNSNLVSGACVYLHCVSRNIYVLYVVWARRLKRFLGDPRR